MGRKALLQRNLRVSIFQLQRADLASPSSKPLGQKARHSQPVGAGNRARWCLQAKPRGGTSRLPLHARKPQRTPCSDCVPQAATETQRPESCAPSALPKRRRPASKCPRPQAQERPEHSPRLPKRAAWSTPAGSRTMDWGHQTAPGLKNRGLLH